MNKWLSSASVLTALAAAPAAGLAGGYGNIDEYYDSAQVLRVDPVTEIVRVEDPREVCWTEQLTYKRPRRYNSHTPEIVGGIIGGVVGNQFGSGSGRDIATVAGVILGGSLGHDYEKRRALAYDAYTGPVQRCEVQSDYYEEERIVGYDVKYQYNGEIYHTRMNRDPGHTLRVRVSLSVAE